jgi:hypothetical protein
VSKTIIIITTHTHTHTHKHINTHTRTKASMHTRTHHPPQAHTVWKLTFSGWGQYWVVWMNKVPRVKCLLLSPSC